MQATITLMALAILNDKYTINRVPSVLKERVQSLVDEKRRDT